jgi:hypothetical protein
MAIDKNSDENLEYYESLAIEEQIYLEECVERLREHEIFVAEMCVRKRACNAEASVEQQDHAAKELITDDSDDRPLSEEADAKMPGAKKAA